MNNRLNRLRFYGLNDYGTFMQSGRFMELVKGFDDTRDDYVTSDIIEYYNLLSFVDKKVFPKETTGDDAIEYEAMKGKLHSLLKDYFTEATRDAGNVLTGVDLLEQEDFVKLMNQYGLTQSLQKESLQSVLENNNVHLSTILSNKKFVTTLDDYLKTKVLSEVDNAEILIEAFFEDKHRSAINIPPSLTAVEIGEMINAYIDSAKPNLNYLKVLMNSKLNEKGAGFDDKKKLKAKKRYEELTEEIFSKGSGLVESGLTIEIVAEQTEPVTFTIEGLVVKYSVSREWLERSVIPIKILKAFINGFDFVDQDMLLTLPSFQADRGVTDMLMGDSGKDSYPLNTVFQHKEMAAFYQTDIFMHFLITKNVNLEDSIEWFYVYYVKEKYGATGFSYSPLPEATKYLHRSRNVFTEMDSVIKQYKTFVQEGRVDRELMSVTSSSVSFGDVPSVTKGKYAYVTEASELEGVLHSLFSSQSSLTFIDDKKQAANFTRLILDNEIHYTDFHDYQVPAIDYLIELDIISNKDGIIRFRSEEQVVILDRLWRYEAFNYYHYTTEIRAEADAMEAKGWLRRESTLLTRAEASYFNYYLNQSEFGNGPDLRNKYLHGSQAPVEDESEHHRTYIIACILMLSLVIKMSDDLMLSRKFPTG
jgi:hypothetical protein